MAKILLFAANPKDTSRLQLDKEIREIAQAVQHAKFGSQFKFEIKVAVRLRDLLQYLEEVQPDIVHFSGHGSRASEIILEDDYGHSRPVPKEELKQIFSLLKGNIRCVVLNACYAEPQANAIAEDIDCVVGMLDEIGDTGAIEFAREFYGQLANGKDIGTAFRLARTHIPNEQNLARLHALKANPSEISFGSDKQKSNNTRIGWTKYLRVGIIPVVLFAIFMTWQYSSIKLQSSPEDESLFSRLLHNKGISFSAFTGTPTSTEAHLSPADTPTVATSTPIPRSTATTVLPKAASTPSVSNSSTPSPTVGTTQFEGMVKDIQYKIVEVTAQKDEVTFWVVAQNTSENVQSWICATACRLFDTDGNLYTASSITINTEKLGSNASVNIPSHAPFRFGVSFPVPSSKKQFAKLEIPVTDGLLEFLNIPALYNVNSQ